MNKTQPIIFLLLVLLFTQIIFPQAPPVREETKALVKSNTEFAVNAYTKMSGKEGNIFFSPLSLSVALTMVLGGAKGETADQIADTLRLNPNQKNLHAEYSLLLDQIIPKNSERGLEKEKIEKKEPHAMSAKEAASGIALNAQTVNVDSTQLFIANALWGQKGLNILSGYQDLLRTHYKSEMQTVDFAGNPQAAASAINNWAEQHTNGRIKDLVQANAFDKDSLLVLANAIYFRAGWQYEFSKSATKPMDFWLNKDKKISAPMMNQEEYLPYFADASLQGLELPYRSGKFSMVVLLPKERDGLAALEKQLSAENLERWLAALKETVVEVSAPKFELDANISLNNLLSNLGMPRAFQNIADFSQMAKYDRGIKLSAALQKTFIKLDEEGTEAAAITNINAAKASVRRIKEPPPVFRADHPFIFLIRERATNSILFLGRLINPSEKTTNAKLETALAQSEVRLPKKFVNEEDSPKREYGKFWVLAIIPFLLMVAGLIIFRKKIFG